MSLLALVLVGILLAGASGLLLLRRCRISLAQLIAGLLTYATLLLPVRALFLEHPQGREWFPAVALGLLLLSTLGIFLGARNAALIPERAPLYHWLFFFSGLLAPATFLPALGLLSILLWGGGPSPLQGHPLGWLFVILLSAPPVSTFFVQAFLNEQHRLWARKQKKAGRD